MIEIKRLVKRFGPVTAVNDLSIRVKDGINGLVGENGAGKSTLLRLISDIYQPNQGSITVDGYNNSDIKAKELIFFLPDDPYAPLNATIGQTFELYNSLFDLDKEKFLDFLGKLNLPLDRKVSTFSKGMKRQFFIALAISSKAKYLLLDEAFDGLDPLVLDNIKQELIKGADEKTFIISSHNISSLERLCDNFIMLSEGVCTINSNIEHIAKNFVKYQVLFNSPASKEQFEEYGFRVISFRKIGSIYNIVFQGDVKEEHLRKLFDMALCENVPLDSEELIAMQMINSRKEVL